MKLYLNPKKPCFQAKGLITIPGTNTAEAAYCGTAFTVMVPLNKPKVLTLKGTAHYISKIPLIGYIIRKIAIIIHNKK